MGQTRLERKQKNMSIIKTSLFVGTLMCLGFVYLAFNIMGM